jgi:hypothetical protein
MPANIFKAGVRALNVPDRQQFYVAGTPSLSIFFPKFTFSADVVESATLDISFSPFVTDIEAAKNSLNVANPLFQASFTGVSGETLNLNAAMPSFSSLFSGESGGVSSFDAAFPSFTVSLRAIGGEVSSLDVASPLFQVGFDVTSGNVGAIDAGFKLFSTQFNIQSGSVSVLDLVYPKFTTAFNLIAGQVSSLDAAFSKFTTSFVTEQAWGINALYPAFVPTFIAAPGTTISLAAAFPVFEPTGFVITVPLLAADYQAWVLNRDNGAHSTYTNFDIRGITSNGSRTFVATADGIYELTGDDDAGANIDAVVTWDFSNFGTGEMKAVDLAYVHARHDGDIRLTATIDETQKRNYDRNMGSPPDGLHTNRFKLARGRKGLMWQFGFENFDGSDFDLMDIQLIPKILKRRVR